MTAATFPITAPATASSRPKSGGIRSISPSSLIIYTGAMFPEWRGDALIGALSGQALIHVRHRRRQCRARPTSGTWARRIREVEQGPDGAVYLLEDGDGRPAAAADAAALSLFDAAGSIEPGEADRGRDGEQQA